MHIKQPRLYTENNKNSPTELQSICSKGEHTLGLRQMRSDLKPSQEVMQVKLQTYKDDHCKYLGHCQ